MKIIAAVKSPNIYLNAPKLTHPISSVNHKTDKFEPSFTGQQYDSGYYTDQEIELAKKYKYAKNFDEHLRTDIWNSFSGWKQLWGSYYKDTQYTFDEVKKLINELSKNDNNLTTKISRLETELSETDKKIIEKENKQKELTEKIEKQITKNKEKQKEIKKIETEQKRISYLKENINNALILPLKAEKELGKKLVVLDRLNGIMVSNASSLMMNALINSVKHNSGCEVEKVDFNDLTEKEVIKKFKEISQSAANKKNRTLIYVENFEKYAKNTPENETIIGKLKNFLQCCSAKYNCIVLTNVDEPNHLSPEINADHRFKIHLDTKNVRENTIMDCVQVLDGYNLKFGLQKEDSVNLFLGDSGYNQEILWIDSFENEKIDAVLENIDKIKKIDKFKKIRQIQCPKPNSTEELKSFVKLENRYTYDNKPIYQKSL